MGDAFHVLSGGAIVPASLLAVAVALYAAWRHRRRAVVRDVDELADLAGATVVGALTPRRAGPGGTDNRQARRLLSSVGAAVGDEPVTVLVLGTGDPEAGEAVAATLAVAADGRGDPVTLVRRTDGAAAWPVPATVREHAWPPGWKADDEPSPAAHDLMELAETEDGGRRTVLLAAPPLDAAADARLLVPLVDAAVVVVELGATPRSAVVDAVGTLAGAGLGTVLVTALEPAAGRPVPDRRPVVGIALAVAAATALLLLVPRVLPPPPDDGATRQAATAGADRREQSRGAGPGRDRAGIHLTAATDPDGTLTVVEQVVLRDPVRAVRVAPPPPPEGATTPPRLVEVRVSADGIPVEVLDGVDEAGTTVRLPAPASRLELTYAVADADARSPEAPTGRATLSLRPATARTFAGLPVVTELAGVSVLALVCPEAPRDERLCGVDQGSRWRTRPMPAAQSAVVALVDLG